MEPSNPFELIAQLASVKTAKKLGSTFSELSKFSKLSQGELERLGKAAKHHATILKHRKELLKLNKQLGSSPGPAAQMNTRRGFLQMSIAQREKWLQRNPYSQSVLQAALANPMAASGSGRRRRPSAAAAGKGGGGIPPNVSSFLQMLGNFMGGQFYYFAKGVNQAGKNLLAFGVALYAGMKIFRLLSNTIRDLRRTVEEYDQIVQMSRSTQISSGGFGNAFRDIRNLRQMQAAGSLFLNDEDYVTARKNFQSLGKDYKQGLEMMQRLSSHTGESIGTLSSQYFDAVQFGGDQLYKTLGMNNRLMQRIMSLFPEGTVSAREAVDRLLQDQEMLNSVMSETPRTIDEMKQRIRGFKDLMVMNLVGEPKDPTSLYSVYRQTFSSIADWLVAHEKQFTQAAAYISRVFKATLRTVSGFIGYMTDRLSDYLNRFYVTQEQLPSRLMAIEIALARLEGRIESFYEKYVPMITDTVKAMWAGLAPLRWMTNGLFWVAKKTAEIVDYLFGSSFQNSSFFASSAGIFVFILSLIRVGKIVTSIFRPLRGLLKVTTAGAGALKKGWTTMAYAFKNLGPLKGATTALKSMGIVISWLLGPIAKLGKLLAKWLGGGLMTSILGGVRGGGKMLSFFKKLPVIGLIISLYEMIRRFQAGDFWGGIISAGAGIAALFPGIGTAISVGLDAVNFGRDLSGRGLNDPSLPRNQQADPSYDTQSIFNDSIPRQKVEQRPYMIENNASPNVSVSITMPPGSDPNEFARRVGDAVHDGTRDALRSFSMRSGVRTDSQTRSLA